MADKYINYPQPKPGQVYGHCDPRRHGMYLMIKSCENGSAKCKSLRTGRTSNIRLDRLRPAHNGYFLAWDPEYAGEVINQIFGAFMTPPRVRKARRCPIQVPAAFEPLVHIPVTAAV
jgi:hypothetical protein